MDDQSIVTLNTVTGINTVRSPTLDFLKINENDNYIEYKISTKKTVKEKKKMDNPFIDHLTSFIFCNESLNIKLPKKEYMIKKNGDKKFAYAIGMFPNPKNGKPAYLDGCILAALGLKRQNTNADVICFITHDIKKKDKEKLEVVFDKVMYVPYISPYDMGGEGELKTILLDKKLFDNCPNYTKQHPYVHVFFKLHIFNPDLFPYEKVCFVDSDLVPLNYYDSLFMLDCPAGFVEYRKKIPYLESYNWDRCDYLKHGEKIPKEITDIDKKSGADVNAGLLLVKPNKKEYDSMIQELTSPLEMWMGPNKKHKGFYSFNFDNPSGIEFIENSYCYPEQNYLTKRYSGKWKFIEFAFQSWALDPCNAFGIHMAAFNPKPWFKQPIGTSVKVDEKYNPYLKNWDKKNIRIPIAIKEESGESYENISYSYEIFNEVIIWGMVNYPKLKNFFTYGTQIHGTKVSFDRDVFRKVIPNKDVQFKLLKDIKKGDTLYRKLSKSQKQITDLINNYEKTVLKVKDNYLQICKKYKGDDDYNYKIITYDNYTTQHDNKVNTFIKKDKFPFGEKKGTPIRQLKKEFILNFIKTNNYRKFPLLREKIMKEHKDIILKKEGGKSKKTQRKKRQNTFHYFSVDWCGYCKKFDPTWKKIVKHFQKDKKLTFQKTIIDDTNQELLTQYNISSYPTLLLEKKNGRKVIFEEERGLPNIRQFLKVNL